MDHFKRLLLIKESQISQVKECSVFLYMGRWSGSPKSFLWCGYLGQHPVLSHPASPQGSRHGYVWGGCSSWLLDGGICFCPHLSQGSPLGLATMWWLVVWNIAVLFCFIYIICKASYLHCHSIMGQATRIKPLLTFCAFIWDGSLSVNTQTYCFCESCISVPYNEFPFTPKSLTSLSFWATLFIY